MFLTTNKQQQKKKSRNPVYYINCIGQTHICSSRNFYRKYLKFKQGKRKKKVPD